MEPSNKALYERVKAAAKRKFDVFPSAYASAYITREYKKRGGTYKGKKDSNKGLKKWFKEKWVDLSRPLEGGGFAPCGRAESAGKKYPKCVPEKIAKKMTKAQIRSAIRRKREAEAKNKGKGKGRKPVNVKTIKGD